MTKQEYIDLAVLEAKKAKGFQLPNPMVGSIIVKDNKIIGKGYHEIVGQAHAEVNAINDAKAKGFDVSGSTIYVTLQPCSKMGRTPACSKAIIENGIKHVVFAVKDIADEDSINQFKENDILAEYFEDKNAEQLVENYLFNAKYNKPYVTIKVATTKDMYTSNVDLNKKWITSEESRLDGRKLRYQHQAILVGNKTIINDNPHLTTRIDNAYDPIIVVIDPKLKISQGSNIFKNDSRKIIFINESTHTKDIDNTEYIKFRGDKISTDDVLKKLWDKGIKSILVDGGVTTIKEFLSENNFNKIINYKSNFEYKENGTNQINLINLKEIKNERIGDDIKITYERN